MDIRWEAAHNYSFYSAKTASGDWVLICKTSTSSEGWKLYGPAFFREFETQGGLYAALDMASAIISANMVDS